MHVTEAAITITTAAPPPTPAHSRVDSKTVSVFVRVLVQVFVCIMCFVVFGSVCVYGVISHTS